MNKLLSHQSNDLNLLLEQLDLICESLDCKLSDLIIRNTNGTPELQQIKLQAIQSNYKQI